MPDCQRFFGCNGELTAWASFLCAPTLFHFGGKLFVVAAAQALGAWELMISDACRPHSSVLYGQSFDLFRQCGRGERGLSNPKSGWLGRQDSNLRMPIPKTGALPLGHAPPGNGGTIRETVRRRNALNRPIFEHFLVCRGPRLQRV